MILESPPICFHTAVAWPLEVDSLTGIFHIREPSCRRTLSRFLWQTLAEAT